MDGVEVSCWNSALRVRRVEVSCARSPSVGALLDLESLWASFEGPMLCEVIGEKVEPRLRTLNEADDGVTLLVRAPESGSMSWKRPRERHEVNRCGRWKDRRKSA